MNTEVWRKISASWEDLENQSSLLFELGAEGLVESGGSNFDCFIFGNEETLSRFLENITSLGVKVIATESVENKNWLEKCEEIWRPVPIGNLRIVPIMTASELNNLEKEEGDIIIIPGQGFGTGHHTATKYVIEQMQGLKLPPGDDKRILDVGCGSGILALAAFKLFQVPVDAIDNDPIALQNARENVSLNGFKEIFLAETPLSEISRQYSLIAANIYAEVLISMRNDFKRLLTSDGYLVLSGIMSNLLNDILSNFSNPDWQVIKIMDDGNWASVLLSSVNIQTDSKYESNIF